jgi:hypothetical protein
MDIEIARNDDGSVKIESMSVTHRFTPEMLDELNRRLMKTLALVDQRDKRLMDIMRGAFATAGLPLPPEWPDEVDVGEPQGRKAPARERRWLERRTHLDQTFRLMALADDIRAIGAGAIGAVWHYNWRDESEPSHHRKWHGKFFAVRGNWAEAQGYIQKPDGKSPAAYIGIEERFGPEWQGDAEAIGEGERFLPTPKGAETNRVMPRWDGSCGCEVRYVYHVEDVPKDALMAR